MSEDRSCAGESAAVPGEEAVQAYAQHKHLLQEALRKHGAFYFTLRDPHTDDSDQGDNHNAGSGDEASAAGGDGSGAAAVQYAGLLNQGATCYLNSLLQTLFMLPEFRNAVIASTATTPIVAELKGLFARLLASTQSALSTKGLTTAFGWSSADVFQQHDVQELCRILFDGLERSDAEVGKAIRDLFAGDMSDSLSCPKCGSVRKKQTAFFDVQLEIRGKSSVQEALNAFLAPEVLDENNKWLCETCNERVQATKAFTFDRWPSIVTLHLKRFDFDLRTMRRVKLFDEIAIPQSLNLSEFSPAPAEGGEPTPATTVELVSILIQSGTAQGGHYYAYIKDVNSPTPRWWEFNDAMVRLVDEEELQSILETTNADPVALEAEAAEDQNVVVERKRNKHAASNAYMLLYRDPSLPPAPVQLDAILKEAIQAENKTHKALVLAYSFHRMLTSLRIFHPFNDDGAEVRSFSLDVVSTTTLADVVRQARDRLLEDLGEAAPADVAAAPLECFRLRRYNHSTSSPGETFGGRESQSLKDLGLHPNATLLLEVRSPDQKFEEFDPSDLHVFLARWDPVANKVDYGSGVRKLTSVPGKLQATVSDLEAVARLAFELGDDKQLAFIKLTGREAVVFEGPDKELRKDYRVGSGDVIVVEERTPPPTTGADTPEVAAAENAELQTLKWFRDQFTSISVQFNHPKKPQVFEYVLQTSLDQALRQLLEEIAKVVELPADEIHLKRNANAPQLKDLDKTLDKLGIVDNSCLCVCEGPTLPPTQHLIEFVILSESQDKKTPLCTLPLDENVLVQDVKEVLVEKMQLAKTHIRLRHPSTRAIIRDDRRLSRVLLNVHDGMQLFVQALPAPEVIGKDDIIVEMREIDYLRKTIQKGKDMVLPKSATAAQMFERVLQAFPHLAASEVQQEGGEDATVPPAVTAPAPASEDGASSAEQPAAEDPFLAAIPSARTVNIAKAYSHGPPLTLKTASKLKWNDPAWLECASVSMPPMSLRDGSVLVVRNVQAYEKAKAAARARLQQQQQQQQQEDGEGAGVPGGGAARPPGTASKFSRLRNRARDQPPAPPAKEHALHIDFSSS